MHALGVIHGSVSPQCVLMEGKDRDSRAYMVDVRRTSSGPSYHSPERAAGGGLSHADDVWALAATLYAALTGGPPFTGASDAEIRQRVLSGSPAPLAVFDVGDDDLQRVLDDAFQRDASQRTTTVSALRAALEEWHPDPNVGGLPALEDEDDGGGDDDDDVEARTIMRPAPRTAADLLGSAQRFPGPAVPSPRASTRGVAVAPARQPPPAVPAASLGDEDDDEKTMMRNAPDVLGAVIGATASSAATRSGAHPAAASGAFSASSAATRSGAHPAAAFPALGAPVPSVHNDEPEEDEATRMMPSPSIPDDAPPPAPRAAGDPLAFGGRPPAPLPADDDDEGQEDEQATLMRPSATPGEIERVLAEMDAKGAPVAAGPSGLASTVALDMLNLPPAPPAAPAAALSPPAVSAPAAASAPAVAPAVPAPAVHGASPMHPAAPRRAGLWLLLVLVMLVGGAVAVFLRFFAR